MVTFSHSMTPRTELPTEVQESHLKPLITLWLAFITLVTLNQFPQANAEEVRPPGKQSWSSFRHDLHQTGVASSELPEKLEKLWEVSLGDQILATAKSFASARNRIFEGWISKLSVFFACTNHLNFEIRYIFVFASLASPSTALSAVLRTVSCRWSFE